MTASGQERRGRGRKSVPGTEAHLTGAELNGLPDGTARAFTLSPGVDLTFEKAGKAWRVETRGGIPAAYLAQFPSVLRVRRRELEQ